ncbi:UDP-N-acetylmuramate--L-alanine ligase [Liquorilactobacillus satsumensis]|uniref:UDP-N-acetylmuramate--L-alanine ligase n=1 Tax=Liquorilactobacillus satsumensis DSM 16230 = JCM 12392 TaxID=1423801 RepID=A0A0R1V3U1_9LACO|nr:UDP-N-acetylmuramate--L-alanine ligase [Liquorilactobacillus satsumensis]KRL99828.1 UDP-N-acetylmuramate--L-alanine ligase [Liquorilactobacillus satsumensis DSM 16230 = JCM 12392]MCC7665682.1 UDP-N-acetylmuramate--L-alanine ligase [Liquorilactobacillus satsumensis]MCP9311894.1 UDP-N-acetylmuramate--L-alanine ligase [Liquorilactobacillus satsumensis]MCP9328306.1 UDP-N-acetylmuramate--L-alanine ligase [Liquorilactobacillus satsumensis]MCP9356525.1 UDP-N-acetylmuramate--L-alanine ligase [Liquo
MNTETTYYFVGIKGTGMSSLALLLHDKGLKVMGSDIEKYTFTQRGLELAGIKILPFAAENIKDGLTIIKGNAFGDDQPEIKRAHELGLQVITYPDFLEKIVENTTSIGIAGAHGKTSTTGLLAHVLGGVAPTSYLVGDGSGKGVPNARFFVFEADEYRRHFVAYHPDYVIMTNIDFDHPDYFTGIEDVFDAFETLANQTKKGIFAWGEDPNLRNLKAKVPVHYYGTSKNDDFRAVNIKRTTKGSSFDVYLHDEFLGNYEIPLYGEHNVLNSLAVIAVSYFEKVDQEEIKEELLTFKGVKRRFTEKFVADMTIIDDYAHHPSEIKATIDAARQKYPSKKIIAVFQPHTFSRTIALMDDFAASLNLADRVFLTDIFSSIREHGGNVSSSDLGDKITKGGTVLKVDNMSPLLDFHDAVVVFMGAGDIQKYEYAYEKLLSSLSLKNN